MLVVKKQVFDLSELVVGWLETKVLWENLVGLVVCSLLVRHDAQVPLKLQ